MMTNVAEAITAIASTLLPGRSVVLRSPSHATPRANRRPLEGGGAGEGRSHEFSDGLARARRANEIKHRQVINTEAPAPKNPPAGSMVLLIEQSRSVAAIIAKTAAAYSADDFHHRSTFAPSVLRRDGG